MNAKEFFDKVVEMRNAQKQYFKTRSKDWLAKSLTFEKEIDAEIARVQSLIKNKQ